ncbi:unnamed protein product [Gongylonema pulchrum]|uniref:Ovule protein n=1 Tax=Gongylonema pulchrum TaxID=637853 RepID=A0A183E9Z1_9BILA|nr:unnamed protein product [Gongylonema pulchrum]
MEPRQPETVVLKLKLLEESVWLFRIELLQIFVPHCIFLLPSSIIHEYSCKKGAKEDLKYYWCSIKIFSLFISTKQVTVLLGELQLKEQVGF